MESNKKKSLIIGFITWLNKNKRNLLVWIILFALFLIFQHKISKILSDYIFIGENEVEQVIFNWIYSFTLGILGIVFIWFFVKNYRLSKSFNFWSLFIGTVYCSLKWLSNTGHLFFLKFTTVQNVTFYYADIFLLILLGVVFLFLRNKFCPNFIWIEKWKRKINVYLSHYNKKENSIYKEDLPIDGSESDNNDKVVNTIIENISAFKPQKAFILGINGEWGNGKTSFLKRLEYQLKFGEKADEISPIIFWFNAWQHQNEKSLINNFFGQLKKELSKHSGNAKGSIDAYLTKLLAFINEKYSKGFTFISNDLLNNPTTITDYYDEVNDLINQVDRKVIVLVDDLDRLNQSEIVEVVRLLRNVANFSNTIFICGLDKEYVLKTADFDSNFLDKIFNLEIQLPKFHQKGLLIEFEDFVKLSSMDNKEEIITVFKSLFDLDISFPLSSDKEKDNIKEEIYEPVPIVPGLFFESRRDVNRFYNYLLTEINVLGNVKEVVLKDYLLFKLLLFKYSWVIKFFDDKRLLDNFKSDNYLVIKKDNLIKELESKSGLSWLEQRIILTVFNKLFPAVDKNKIDVREKYVRRINKKRYIPIYLNNNVFNQALSYSELLDAYDNDKIEDFIESKILKSEDKLSLLNDLKPFLLDPENLGNDGMIIQVINLYNKYWSDNTNSQEIVHIINVVNLNVSNEQRKIEIVDKYLFNDINNLFGKFLRALNFVYKYEGIPDNPLDIYVDELSGYLYSDDLEKLELELVTIEYVRNKIILLFKDFIEKDPPFEEIIFVLQYCIVFHSSSLEQGIYYNRISKIIMVYLKNNIIKVLKDYPVEDALWADWVGILLPVFTENSLSNRVIKILTSQLKSDYKQKSGENFISFLENLADDINKNDEKKIIKEAIMEFKELIL